MEGDSFREEERRAGELVELDRDNAGSEPEPVADFCRACSSAIRESMAPLSRCGQVSFYYEDKAAMERERER